MNEHTQRAGLHRYWASPRTSRTVDKKGLAVALTFLVAISFWLGGRGGKTAEQDSTWQKQPDLSAQVQIHLAAKMSPDAETGQPVQSMTGLRRELEDPRRGR
jgi:hypothetical protein